MRKFLSIICIVVLLLASFSFQCFAENSTSSTVFLIHDHSDISSISCIRINKIKNAIRQQYNLRDSISIVIIGIDELEQSEMYGSWSSTYFNYNCYAYAIGYTDDFYDPGFTNPNHIITNSTTISTIAAYAKEDLQSSLSYSCVHVTSSMPDSNIVSGRSVICVRKQTNAVGGFCDYHFMKLTNDGWLHKPGSGAILHALSAPTYNTAWKMEGIGVFEIEGNYYICGYYIDDEDAYYDSELRYLTFGTTHTYSTTWVPYSSTEHRAYCHCGEYESELHDFVWVGRKQICSVCGYMYGGGGISPDSVD